MKMKEDFLSTIAGRYVVMTAVAFALSTIAGCGSRAPRSFSSGDVEQAKAKLDSTLNAWKEGKTPADLRGLKPPVYVADQDWNTGKKLFEFRIDRVEKTTGPNPNLVVVLTLDDAKSKATKKQVVYSVTTAPAITIARTDMN
jgi:predicted small lipoprotein YifL